MARDQYEYDVGGEIRDRYGRPETVLVPKHTTPLSTDTIRAYQPADADGRPHVVMQDANGNDLATTMANVSSFAVNVMDPAFGAKGDGTTNDAAAVQAAINAASAKAPANGACDIWLPSGFEFNLGPITIPSGVRIWANGAAIIPNLSALGTLPLIRITSGSTVNRFELHGGSFIGTGSENQASQVFFISGGATSVKDVIIDGVYVNNWAAGPFGINGATRATVRNCTLLGVGGPNRLNCIGFGMVSTNYNQVTECLAIGNIVESNYGGAIGWVNTGGGTGTIDAQFTALGNVCRVGAVSLNDSGILFEVDNAGANSTTNCGAVIGQNQIFVPAGGSGGYCVYANVTSSTGLQTEVKINDNRMVNLSSVTPFSLSTVAGSEFHVTNNRVRATTQGTGYGLIGSNVYHAGNKFSTGPMMGRATLVAGSATVNTAEIQANDNVVLSRVVAGGTLGELSVGTITAGTSFTITSSSGTDTSAVFWQIVH